MAIDNIASIYLNRLIDKLTYLITINEKLNIMIYIDLVCTKYISYKMNIKYCIPTLLDYI